MRVPLPAAMITMSSAMRRPSFVRGPIIGGLRAARAWLLVLCLALLSGCSLLRLTYPQLPTIAYWWLDGYVDFTVAQAPRVQEQLAEWLRWHRSHPVARLCGTAAAGARPSCSPTPRRPRCAAGSTRGRRAC